jgi:ABC-2 type transport system ATP-binding protein/ribosome-dependent ATPase
MTLLVEATGVTRRFGRFTANDNIDLRVEAGEVVGLLGANGAGKSTFMRIVLGILAPTSGRVRLFGEPPSREIRRRIGYVPQGLGLYDDLTVAENLEFVAGAYATPPIELDEDVEEYRNRLVAEIPLGLRRRIAFSAALAHDPTMLVLDEPTSGVDPLARSGLWDTIRDSADRGAGVLVSTHYMEEAEHCDRLVVLAEGRVVVASTLAEILAGRTAVQVSTAQWDRAFAALDGAGLPTALHGRHLRVLGVEESAVRAVLDGAGITGDTERVPATFEEAFVELVRER